MSPQAATSRKAVVSLILAIASFGLGLAASGPALVVGALSLVLAVGAGWDIRRSKGRLKGGGVVGWTLGVLLAGVVSLWLQHAVERVREAAGRTQSNGQLFQLASTLRNYHDSHGVLPPAAVYDKGGRPLLSWRVLLLPHIEESALYRQFQLDEPWDGPHNAHLLGRMPRIYASISRRGPQPPPYHTFIQAFTGSGAAFEGEEGLKVPDDFPDGPENTFLLVEGGEPVPWTKPEDIAYAADRPLPDLATVWGDGFWVALANGRARFIKKETSEGTIRAAITRNGGETLGPDW